MSNKLLALTAVLAVATTAPAHAAKVIDTITFGAGEDVYAAGPHYAAGPGRYRFDILFSTPVDFQDGYVTDTVTDTYFQDFNDGNGYQYIGGDDVPYQFGYLPKSPLLYSAIVKVGNSYLEQTSPEPYGSQHYHGEDCCYVGVDFHAYNAGTATFTVSPVPEPTTWTLMIIGIGIVGAAMRRAKARPVVVLRQPTIRG